MGFPDGGLVASRSEDRGDRAGTSQKWCRERHQRDAHRLDRLAVTQLVVSAQHQLRGDEEQQQPSRGLQRRHRHLEVGEDLFFHRPNSAAFTTTAPVAIRAMVGAGSRLSDG